MTWGDIIITGERVEKGGGDMNEYLHCDAMDDDDYNMYLW